MLKKIIFPAILLFAFNAHSMVTKKVNDDGSITLSQKSCDYSMTTICTKHSSGEFTGKLETSLPKTEAFNASDAQYYFEDMEKDWMAQQKAKIRCEN